jgi:MGT family glycosyltransferase
MPDGRATEGVPVHPVPQEYAKAGIEYAARLRVRQGTSLIDFLRYSGARAETLCRHAPEALRAAKADCVLVDMGDPGAATAAEIANLPFITISNALPLNRDPGVPPDFLPWPYRADRWAQWRNLGAYRLRDLLLAPLHRVINKHRRRHHLRRYTSVDDSFSSLAQITQLIPDFDLPRQRALHCLQYVGPYRRNTETQSDLSHFRLDGRPVVYASLGTVQGDRAVIWSAIARGCSALHVQLILALGRKGLSQTMPPLPGNPTVVDFAPQKQLLTKAAVVITHAGLNTAMESLAAGTPMVALPIAGDQFGVSQRIAYSGTGVVLHPANRSAGRIRSAVERVLANPGYRDRALHLKSVIEKTGGADAAAQIIEAAMTRHERQ